MGEWATDRSVAPGLHFKQVPLADVGEEGGGMHMETGHEVLKGQTWQSGMWEGSQDDGSCGLITWVYLRHTHLSLQIQT